MPEVNRIEKMWEQFLGGENPSEPSTSDDRMDVIGTRRKKMVQKLSRFLAEQMAGEKRTFEDSVADTQALTGCLATVAIGSVGFGIEHLIPLSTAIAAAIADYIEEHANSKE